jgi:hypothetical protein
MFEENPGDFSPRPDLNYKFEIKKGQKIKLITGGNAEPRSYIKATSQAF